MSGLVWDEQPDLRRPILVAAFKGWNDAGDAATDAVEWLTHRFDARPFATIDPDEYVDFQSTRPIVELVDGVTRSIVWPTNTFFAATSTESERDLVLLSGVEPSYRWRSFCEEVLEVADTLGCELVVTFGALLGDVPHTRPAPLTGTASDDLIAKLGLQSSRYEGPTGIVGVLHDACRQHHRLSASLWAPVPHYVATPPNPVATRTLLGGLDRLAGLSLDLQELDVMSDLWRTRVNEVVAGDEEAANYVHQLEGQADENAPMPPGETLVEELEQFLRDQRED